MATIENNTSNTVISGTDLNDSISNNSSDVSIDTGAGNDTISTGYSSNVTVTSGSGNNRIDSWGGQFINVSTGDGDDKFYGDVSNATINIGNGNNEIYMWGGNTVKIAAGDGNDTITTYSYNTTIDAGNGKNKIEFWSNAIKISTGDDNDTISGYSSNSTIDAGDGNNSIKSEGNSVKISTGNGNDTISTEANSSDITINTGKGDDLISLNSSNNFIVYSAGDGNDIIKGFNKNSTIQILADEINKISSDGENIFLTVGQNTLTIERGVLSDTLNIVDKDSNKFDFDMIFEPVVTDEADLVKNYLSNVTISTGGDNDTIFNSGGSVTINGGQGDDFISLDAAAQNNLIVYNSGDGFDTVEGFSTNTTLQINGGDDNYSTQLSGTDIIVTVGEEQILLKTDQKYLDKININGKKINLPRIIRLKDGGDSISNELDNLTILGGNGNDYIENYGDSLSIDGSAGDDTVYNYDGDIGSINLGEGNDSLYNYYGDGLSINGGAGDDTVYNHASGNIIDLGDGNDSIYAFGGEQNSIKSGAGNDYITNDGTNVTLDADEGDDTINNYGDNVTLNSGSGNDEIYSSCCNNISINSGIGNDSIYIGTYTSGGVAHYSNNVTINLGDGDNSLQNVGGNHILISAGDGNNTIRNSFDSWGCRGEYTKINVGNGNNLIRNSGDYTTINSGTGDDIINNWGSNVTVNASDGNNSIANGAANVVIGSGTGRDTITNSGSQVSISTGDDNDLIINNGGDDDLFIVIPKDVTIEAGGGSDTIDSSYGNNVTIDAGDGNDSIEVLGSNYYIRGGKGNDSVNLRDKGNDTEYIYEYAPGDGDDVVSRDALISLIDGAMVDDTLIRGSDLILKIGEGSITIKDYIDSDEIEIPTIDSDNKDYYLGYDEVQSSSNNSVVQVVNRSHKNSNIRLEGGICTLRAGDGNDTIVTPKTNSTKNSIDGGPGRDIILNNGSETTIDGGAGNDKIINGGIIEYIFDCPPEAPNNSVKGGKGNDSIQNNGSNCTVEGNEDKDLINNYGRGSSANGGADNDTVTNGDQDGSGLEKKRQNALNEFKGFLRENLNASLSKFQNNDVLMDIVRNGLESEYFKNDGSVFSEQDKNELVELMRAQYNYLNNLNDTDMSDISELYSHLEGLLDINDRIDVFEKRLSDENFCYSQEYKRLQFKKQYFDALPGLENRFPKVKEYLDSGGSYDDLFRPNESRYPTLSKVREIRNGSVTAMGKAATTVLTDPNIPQNVVGEALSEAATAIDLLDANKKVWEITDVLLDDTLSPQERDIKGGTTALDLAAVGGAIMAGGVIAVTAVLGAPIWAGVAAGVGIGLIIGHEIKIRKMEHVNNVNSHTYPNRNSNSRHVDNQLMAAYSNNVASEDASYDSLIKAYVSNLDTTTDGIIVTTLLGSQGDDILVNNAENFVLMDGGENNDTIENYNSSNVTMLGGDGNDIIGNLNSPDVTIDGGTGNDTIGNQESDRVLINTGDGNNSVTNCESSDVTILTGDGNNYIDNLGNRTSIQTGDGSDSIINMGDNVSIQSGGGADVVWSMGDSVSIQTGEGNDLVKSFGNNVAINLGAGDNFIHAEGENFSVTAGNGNNSIETNFNLYTVIQTGAGNDYFMNGGSNMTINAGDGNNIINNIGDSNLILSGKDDDYLENIGDNNLIEMGAGEDFLELIGNYNVVNGGADNDLILIDEGANNTIAGNKGNDLIINGIFAEYTLFEYNVGDGNDTVYGFNTISTLKIGNGKDTYLIQDSGSDILVNVGEETITLVDAASLSAINIEGTEIFKNKWTLNGTTATYGTPNETLITVTGVKSLDGLFLKDKVMTVSAAALDAKDVTISDGYTLALGSDVTKTSTTSAGWAFSNNVASYKDSSTSAGYKLADNKISYVNASGGETLVTVSGVKSLDGISLNGKLVTVSNASLDGSEVTISGTGYTLALGNDVTKSSTTNAGWTYDNNVASYKDSSTSAGYKLADNKISYVNASGGETLVTVSGVKSLDGISLNGKLVTVSNASLDGSEVTISGTGYSLALGNDVTKSSTTDAGWTYDNNVASYKDSSTSAGYKLADNKISYVNASGGETLVTVSGVKSLDGISLNGKLVTVSNASLDGSEVTINGTGYTLALGNDVTKTSTTNAGWTYSDKVATYKDSSTSAGYKLSENKISYVSASGGETLVTVNGVKSLDGVSLNDKVVTVSNAALDGKDVTISGKGYSLALGNDVTKTSTTEAGWTYSDKVATYKDFSTSAGYKLSENKISYVAASGGETLVTVSGVKSLDGISLNGKLVTVSNASLDGSEVTISGTGYTLALGNDVTKTSTTNAGWTYDNNVASYKDSSTSAGYKLSENKISYVAASGGETLVTVNGVKSLDGISLNGKVVTVSAASLDGSEVTISGTGYTLALGSDVTKTSTTNAGWTYSDKVATYKDSSTSAGYKLSENKISYVSASGGETLVTVNGVKSLDGVSLNGKVVTVSNAALDGKDVTISGKGYSLALGNDVTKTSTTNAGWTYSDKVATYKDSSTSAGYKLSENKISYVSASGGETLVTVSGVKSLDGISLNGKLVTVSNASLDGSEVTINGTGYTLALGNDVTKTSTTNAGWTYDNNVAAYKDSSTSAGYKLSENKISYVSASGGETLVTVSGVKSLEGISLNGKVVTVLNASLDGNDVTISGNGYTLALGNDVTKTSTTNAGWTYSNNVATYKDSYTSAGYILADDKISYVAASGGETLATVSGVKSLDGVSLNGKLVTVSNASLDGSEVTISGTGYSLALGNDVTKSSTTDAGWNALSFGKATYNFASTTAGYSLANNKVSYTEATAPKSFTVTGIKSTSGIKVDGSTVTLKAANLNKKAVTISDGFTLKLADDVAAPVATKAGWSKVSSGKATYNFASTTAGYSLANNKVSYTEATAPKSFTVSGIKSTSGITVDGSTITLKAANLNKKTVTISDGYTLKLADDVAAPVATKAGWSKVSSGKATYNFASTTAGYSLANNKISYTAATAPKSFTVTGIKSTSGITVDGSTITLKAANLNKKTVTISDGYTLKLANDVAAPVETKAGWSKVSSGKATYNFASTTAGYSLANNKISYTAATAPKSFTVTGIKSTSGITVDGSTITLKAANLNKKTVTISDGYTLKLANDVAAPVETKAGWSKVSSGKATYNFASTTAGYSLANNKVSYTEATAPKSFTVTGIKSTSGIKVDGTTVTLKAANLNKKAVTISNGYTLKLANDVTVPTTLAPTWTVNDTNATLHTDTSAGYTVENKKILYTAKKTGDAQIALGGLIKNAKLSLPENKTLTLDANVLSANASIKSNASSYTVKLTGDMKGKKFVGTSGADTLNIAAKNASVEGDKGNDKLLGGANNDSINGGNGNDTLSGGAGNDKLLGGANNDSLHGGSGNDILSGGTGNDTLIGSTGNDSLHGGTGKDLFVFSAGNDTIADYTPGTDKISVSSSLGDAIFSVANNKVVLTYSENSLTILNGSDKVITFADNKKFIYTKDGRFNGNKTYVTLSAATKTFNATNYSDLVTIDGSATSKLNITGNALANSILGGASNDILNGGAGNDTLSGSAGNDKLLGGAGNDSLNGGDGADTLSGGSGNDKLLGGKGNDSLWGGTGNDTLYGGAGSDIFIYKPNEGTDKIMDYETGDMLKILKANGSAGGSFTKSSFSNNKLTLTISGGGTVVFDGVKSGDAFNINGITHTLSGKKLK